MKLTRKLFSQGGSGKPPDETEAILSRHLDGDFRVFPMAETETSAAQIEAIGRTYSVVYPQELVAHICGRFPGLYVEVKEEIWPRPKPYEVGAFWSFLHALHTFTSAPESPDWMRLDHAAESFQKGTRLMAAPVLKVVGDADLYCVDPDGRLVRFIHEENKLEPLPIGFWQLFESEIAELRARKEQKKAGE